MLRDDVDQVKRIVDEAIAPLAGEIASLKDKIAAANAGLVVVQEKIESKPVAEKPAAKKEVKE